jgi:hypothetical protein
MKCVPHARKSWPDRELGSVSEHVIATCRDEILSVSERRSYVKMSLETESSFRRSRAGRIPRILFLVRE